MQIKLLELDERLTPELGFTCGFCTEGFPQISKLFIGRSGKGCPECIGLARDMIQRELSAEEDGGGEAA